MNKSPFYYYLHTNGELIYKPAMVVETDPEYFNSPFVRKVFHITCRKDALRMLLECKKSGANAECIKRLEETNEITPKDYLGIEDNDRETKT